MLVESCRLSEESLAELVACGWNFLVENLVDLPEPFCMTAEIFRASSNAEYKQNSGTMGLSRSNLTERGQVQPR